MNITDIEELVKEVNSLMQIDYSLRQAVLTSPKAKSLLFKQDKFIPFKEEYEREFLDKFEADISKTEYNIRAKNYDTE